MNDIELHRVKLLVEQARAGRQTAFAELVSMHHLRVWRFILKSVHNPQDAEELAQETFLAAWRSLGSYRGDSRFSTWLLGIALNLARNHCNRSPSRREVELPEAEQLESLLAEGLDPYELVRQKHKLEALQEAMAQLPPELREVITLVRLEGLSLEDAAGLLDIPLGTVKSRLSRARSRLAEDMHAHFS
ncbi:RNA polymerase sigma factor [Azovibrio restrictus]|uniref:RNA polymerase sigma factor n=1 Tax=Azovibrio restrictus TaxID=146938 RepID=UPI0026F1B4A5|nr:sigma-70 family RNA polymerase sigma factor [Azovibrio restrictus]MDD3483796.1 sigma-70 family RNA polymerase sigma factor [Azovibrio restrictus]